MVLGPHLGKCWPNGCWAPARAWRSAADQVRRGSCPQRVAADQLSTEGKMPGQPALATAASEESHTREGERADATAWGPGERSLWYASLSGSLRKPGWQGHGCPSEPPVRPQGPRLLPSPPVPAQPQFLSGLSHALYTKPSVGISELRIFLTSTPRSNTQTAERKGSSRLCKARPGAPSPALPWGSSLYQVRFSLTPIPGPLPPGQSSACVSCIESKAQVRTTALPSRGVTFPWEFRDGDPEPESHQRAHSHSRALSAFCSPVYSLGQGGQGV